MFSVEKEEIISKSSTLEYMDQNSLTTVILITAVQILLKRLRQKFRADREKTP